MHLNVVIFMFEGGYMSLQLKHASHSFFSGCCNPLCLCYCSSDTAVLPSCCDISTLFSYCFSLLILIVLNLGLFFKLWAMEDVAHRMYLTTKHRLRERMETRLDKLLIFSRVNL